MPTWSGFSGARGRERPPGRRGPAGLTRSIRPGRGARPGACVQCVMLLAFATVLVPGCREGPEPEASFGSAPIGGEGLAETPLNEVFEWIGTIELEETDHVINVRPAANLDSFGEILVADQGEGQVRVYRRDGVLQAAFPETLTMTDRPFVMPTGLLRAPDSTLIVVDRVAGSPQVTILDPSADSVLRRVAVDVGRINQARLSEDHGLMLFTLFRPDGSPDDGAHLASGLGYIVDLRTGSIRNRFFDLIVPAGMGPAHGIAGWSGGRLRGDTIASFYSLSDTVYLFERQGRLFEKIPLPTRMFRRARELPSEGFRDRSERAEWVASFSMVSDMWWPSTGEFVLETIDYDEQGAIRLHLLIMDRDGSQIAEIRDTPRLRWVEEDGSSYYFSNVDGEGENRWRIARRL